MLTTVADHDQDSNLGYHGCEPSGTTYELSHYPTVNLFLHHLL